MTAGFVVSRCDYESNINEYTEKSENKGRFAAKLAHKNRVLMEFFKK